MLIVSQEKYNILNFDTTINIGVEEISTLNDIVQISAQTNGNTIILGRYKTEERAKEILKDIILRYEAIELCKNKSSEDLGYTLGDYTPVYEMPKE